MQKQIVKTDEFIRHLDACKNQRQACVQQIVDILKTSLANLGITDETKIAEYAKPIIADKVATIDETISFMERFVDIIEVADEQ
jgi:hypothetical protein